MPFKSDKQRRYVMWKMHGKFPMRVHVKKHEKRVGNHSGNIITIDNDVPKKYRPSLIKHEFVENRLQRAGIAPKKAHNIAERIERETFPGTKKEWHKYDRVVNRIYKKENKYA